VVSFTPRPLYPHRKKPPGTHCIGDWVGPRAGLDDVEKRKFLILPGQVVIPTAVIIFFNSLSGVWSPNWVHSARRPFTGLLYLPPVIVRMVNLVE
jgi:hypothetical protein